MPDLRTELRRAAGAPRFVDPELILTRAARQRRRQWAGAAVALSLLVAGSAIAVAARPTAGRKTTPPVHSATPTPTPSPNPTSDPFTQAELGGFETIDKPAPGQVRLITMANSRVFVIAHLDGSVTVADAETRTPAAPKQWAIINSQIGWCPTTRNLQDPFGGEQWTETGLSYRGGSIEFHYVRPSVAQPGRLDVTRGWAEGGPDEATPPVPPPCAPGTLLLHDNNVFPKATVETAAVSPDLHRVDGYLDVNLLDVQLCAHLTAGRCANGLRVDAEVVVAYDRVGSYVLEGTFLVRRQQPENAARGILVTRLPGTQLLARHDVGARHVIGFVRNVQVLGDGSADIGFDSTRYEDGSVLEVGAPGKPPPLPKDCPPLVSNSRSGLVTYRAVTEALAYDQRRQNGEPPVSPVTQNLRDLAARVTARPPDDQGPLYWLVLDARGRVLRFLEQCR